MGQNCKVYTKQPGDEMIIASGGKITVESGGSIEVASGGSVNVASGGALVSRGILRPFVTTDAATLALTAAQSGAVILATKSSVTQTFALPAATTAGLEFTFVCGHADGEINIDPGATTHTIVGISISVAAGKDLKNTAASNAVGDCVTLVADGTSKWVITQMQGTWAST